MSLPHFYLSNGQHFNGSGVSDPLKGLHESFAEIEPVTFSKISLNKLLFFEKLQNNSFSTTV